MTLLTGAAAGALNGVFVAFVRVHPLIVTLATLAAYQGIAEGISLDRPVSGFPAAVTQWGQGTLWGLPIPGLIFVAALAATAFVVTRTPLGLRLSAIGYNETAARYSGIAVACLKLLLYTASGLTAALAALLFVARRSTAKADIGTGMELTVITAVVLGGTSIFGGRGRLFGTVLGVLLIHEDPRVPELAVEPRRTHPNRHRRPSPPVRPRRQLAFAQETVTALIGTSAGWKPTPLSRHH